MKKLITHTLISTVLIFWICSCEYNFKIALGSRIDGRYMAEKVQNTRTGQTTYLDTILNKQFLSFLGDTLRITRNDTVIEQLVSYDLKYWVGRRSRGVTIYSGMTWFGRKDFMIEVENIKNMSPSRITVGTIMKEPYDEKLDTLKTVYRPL